MFADTSVDLVISDNSLPDIAGVDIIKEMKRLRPTVPIMMLSGLPESPLGGEIADLFVNKDTSTETFLINVANLLKPKTVR